MFKKLKEKLKAFIDKLKVLRNKVCAKVPYGDKGCHYIAGLIIAIVAAPFIGPLYAFLLGVLIGLLKELLDEYNYQGGDFFDFLTTAAGSLTGMGIFIIIDFLLTK